MVVHPGARPSPMGQSTRQSLRNLLRGARELPFETGDGRQWHRAVSSFAARIHATLEREGAPDTLKEACGALVRDLVEIKEPSLLDVARVSDRLFEMEDEMARIPG